MVDLSSNWNIIHSLESWEHITFPQVLLFCGCCWRKLQKTWMLVVLLMTLRNQYNSSYSSAGSKKQGNTDERNSQLCSGDMHPTFLSRKVSEHSTDCSWSKSFEVFRLQLVTCCKRIRFHPPASFDLQFLVCASTWLTPKWGFLWQILECSEWVAFALHWMAQVGKYVK